MRANSLPVSLAFNPNKPSSFLLTCRRVSRERLLADGLNGYSGCAGISVVAVSTGPFLPRSSFGYASATRNTFL